ncbi:MAG: hypothetical protein OXG96_09775 [Acidobacteria bacterium]|nr:hypothetical protein [Acidobacteriota bacterium]
MILFNRRMRILAVLALLLPVTSEGAEPQALSIAPLGGKKGTRLEATLRGRSLQEAYAVRFDREGVTATVERVEELEAEGAVDPSEELPKAQILTLGLRIDQSAGTGRYQLRVVSPQGVTGPLSFLVHDLPSVSEKHPSSDQASSAQAVDFPCAINGVISRPGERDLYAVQADEGQHLRFELISNPSGTAMGGRAGYRGGFDSVLTLYQPLGSWFEEDRLHRLAYDDKSKANPRPNPRIETRGGQPGLYLLEVGSFYNLGGPEFSYQLRVEPNGPADPQRPQITANGSRSEPWRERSFSRPIGPDHIRRILSRAVEPGNGVGGASAENGRSPHEKANRSASTAYSIIREQEPNDDSAPTAVAALPFLVEGSIDRPGDVDRLVSFRVQPGRKLGFEMETPEASLPDFNPRWAVVDQAGKVVLSNVYRRVVRQALSYSKTIEPKTIHTFLRGGTYTLRVRDTTQRNGASDFRYRLLVRPQIPHAGELKVQEDRLNLVPGEAGKLTVTTGQEEGFAGQILLQVEGLPPGVQALPGTDYQPEAPPNLDEGPKARYMPQQGATSVMIVAAEDAAATRMPRILRIQARPVVSGKMGALLPVGKVHLMVLKGNRPQAAANSP